MTAFLDLVDETHPAREPKTYDNPLRNSWEQDGYVVLEKFLPDDLVEAYCRKRKLVGPGGWESPTPYLNVPELKDICLFPGLMAVLSTLIGKEMGLHLNLTGWVSTERDLHQDAYLNPVHVGDDYAAVWMALDDIHPDSGPFQFVPGSHLWPMLDQEKVKALLTPEEAASPMWPKHTERFLTEIAEAHIKEQYAEVKTWAGKKGDVLIWSARLLHRGSKPNQPGMIRKALISHYSALTREDMPTQAEHKPGWGKYMVFG